MTGMPNRMFMSVDLPAPFSPTRAWISPGARERLTPFSTRWPEYSLLMFLSSRTSCPAKVLGSVVDAVDQDQVAVALPGSGSSQAGDVASGVFLKRHRDVGMNQLL